MNTYTTPTGIKVLLPQVPIDTYGLMLSFPCKPRNVNTLLHGYKTTGAICVERELGVIPNSSTILGTCWREGGKLICDFDPAKLVEKTEAFGYPLLWICYTQPLSGFCDSPQRSFDSWLLSIGEKIKEGHKIVVIKVE